tara:strand:- start:532 stop:1236 length:705 start_codon:yes stop_codon:yes gene_type:complete
MFSKIKQNLKRNIILNSIFSKIIEKFYSESGVNITLKTLLDKSKINKNSIKVIYDIGCHKGEWTKDIKSLFPNSIVYQFDAVNYPKEDLRNVFFNQVCLGDKCEKQNFYKRCESGDSLFKEKGEIYSKQDKITIDVETLDFFLKKRKIKNPNYLKIDAQGAELIILKGAQNCIKDTEFIQLEVSYVEYNEGGCLLEEVLPFMRSNNFTPIAFSHIKGDDHRIIQSDILFQKNRK